jgi:hypothetical protein
VLVDIRTAGIPRDRLRDIAEQLAGAPVTRLAERRSEIATTARRGKVTLIGTHPEIGREPAFERL